MAEPENPRIVVFDSITQLTTADAGHVAVAGSHGGLYAAYVAARGGVRGVILNDAGRGLEDAGIACLAYMGELGVACAVVGHDSARIGSGEDTVRRGILTGVNAQAARLGCFVGQRCADAAQLLLKGAVSDRVPPAYEESRFLLRDGAVKVWGVDSAALVKPADAGSIVVTGSHGALLGDRPELAVRAEVVGAVFHDAGIGIDRAGLSRLPALDKRGIAGATVAADSARIGDARSIWTTGRLSAVNERAQACGAAVGMTVPAFADAVIAHTAKQG